MHESGQRLSCAQMFNLAITKNTGYRYTVRYAHDKYSQRLHVLRFPNGKTFQVKTLLDKHADNCSKLLVIPMANSTWIVQQLIDEFRLRGDMDAKDIKNTVLGTYLVQLKKHVAKRVRRRMLFKIKRRHDLSQLKLAHYKEMVKKINPGSRVYDTQDNPQPPSKTIDVGDNVPPIPSFKRCFSNLKGAIDGFSKECRPIIEVHWTHLKGPYKAVLLTAMRLDVKNHSYPLA